MGCNKNQFQFVCQRIAEQPTLYFCIRIRHPSMFFSIVYTRGRERSRVVSLKIRFGLVFREKSQLTPQLPSLFFSFSVRTIMTVKSDIYTQRSTNYYICTYYGGFRLPIKNWDTQILHFEKVINFAILLVCAMCRTI